MARYTHFHGIDGCRENWSILSPFLFSHSAEIKRRGERERREKRGAGESKRSRVNLQGES